MEVEAYVGTDDLASHARFGRTTRNAVMFGPPGVAYVYLVYGMYDCLNVVTEPEGTAAAVLVRAVEPLAGLAAMRAARLRHARARRRAAEPASLRVQLDSVPDHRLASGPGVLAAAFDIRREQTGLDLCDPASPIRLEHGDRPPPVVATGPRVGIAYAPEPWRSRPWRYVDPASPSVSGPRSRPGRLGR